MTRLQVEQLQLNCSKQENHEERCFIQVPKDGKHLLWSLRHPIRAIELIKRYHLVGNVAITLYTIFNFILIHIFIKSIVQFNAGDDEKMLDYFESIYYPHIAGLSKHPTDYNTILLGFVIFFLCFRIKNLLRLIELAVINANTYEELHVPQLNLAYMTAFNLNISQWLGIWRQASNHAKAIKSSKTKYRNHLEFDEQIHEQLSKSYNKYSGYHYNLIDFQECYSGLEFIQDQNRKSKNYKLWHTSYPIDRQSLVDLKKTALFTILLTSSSFSGLLFFILATMYTDLARPFPENYSPNFYDLIGNIPKHWTQWLNIIRAFELLFIFFCQVSQIFESIKVAFDIHLTTSRAGKLVEIFRLHLETCRKQAIRARLVKICKNSKSSREYQGGRKYDRKQQFNTRISRDVALTRLIYLEFLNLKKNHTASLNILVLGGSACMSYTVSLVMRFNNDTEIVLLYLTFISCLVPLIINLIACARVEKTFKQLYHIICRVSASSETFIELDTKSLLTRVSEPLIKNENRSFVIGGLYAITLNSLGPFIAYMASAILLMQKVEVDKDYQR